MNEVVTATTELKAQLPHYLQTNQQDERAQYFRGLDIAAMGSVCARA
jgi:hypothetical protein